MDQAIFVGLLLLSPIGIRGQSTIALAGTGMGPVMDGAASRPYRGVWALALMRDFRSHGGELSMP